MMLVRLVRMLQRGMTVTVAGSVTNDGGGGIFRLGRNRVGVVYYWW